MTATLAELRAQSTNVWPTPVSIGRTVVDPLLGSRTVLLNIVCSVNEQERDALFAAATAANQNAGDFIRDAAIARLTDASADQLAKDLHWLATAAGSTTHALRALRQATGQLSTEDFPAAGLATVEGNGRASTQRPTLTAESRQQPTDDGSTS